MFITEFNQTRAEKIKKANKFLREQFNVSIDTAFPKKEKLLKIKALSEDAITKCKESGKFQHNPEYVKYLGVRDVVDTMLAEGQYAKSKAYHHLIAKIKDMVHQLMDMGYTDTECKAEAMNKIRLDASHCYEDNVTLPMVEMAIDEYMQEGKIGGTLGAAGGALGGAALGATTELGQQAGQQIGNLLGKTGGDVLGGGVAGAAADAVGMGGKALGGLAGGVIGAGLGALAGDALTGESLEEQIRQALDEGDAESAKALIAQLKEKKAKPDYIDIDGDGDKKEPMKKAAKDAKMKKESMFDDIINDMIAEEVESVEEAEVVMAVRALSDDLQDQVERLGRMVNEDLPAIVSQMVNEFGSAQAQQFKSSMEQLISSSLEVSKQTKDGIDSLVIGMTGGQDASLMAPGSEMPAEMPAEPEMDNNEPSAAGPEDEPLGRAPVNL